MQDSLESPGLEMEEVQDEPNMPQDVAADEVRRLEAEQDQQSEQKACPVLFGSRPRPQALRMQRRKRTRSVFFFFNLLFFRCYILSVF